MDILKILTCFLLLSAIQSGKSLNKDAKKIRSNERSYYFKKFSKYNSLEEFLETNTFNIEETNKISKFYNLYKNTQNEISESVKSNSTQIITPLDPLITEITIGTPAQKFEVAIDTLSSNTYVPSNNCLYCSTKYTYDKSKSSTYSNPNNYLFRKEISDAKSFIIAYISQDKISINNQTVDYQFGEVNFRGGNALDSVLGLGTKDFSGQGNLTSILKTISNTTKTNYSYSLYFNSDDESTLIEFGGFNTKYFKGDLKYFQLTQGYIINLTSFKVNNESIEVENASIISLHSEIYVPLIAGIKLDDQINIQQNCSNVKNLPVVYLNVSGSEIELAPSDYTVFNEGKCSTAFIPTSVVGNQVYLGNLFLKKYFTYFDFANEKIGIALAN